MIPGVNIISIYIGLKHLNATETSTVQDYKRTKNRGEWKYTYSVKAKPRAGNIWVKYVMTAQRDQNRKKISQES